MTAWANARAAKLSPGSTIVTLSIGMTLLILLAAVMHAGWNVLVKFGSDAFLNMGLIVGMGGLLGLVLTPFVDFPEPESWIWLFGSCVFHLGYYTFLVMAYRHGELSQVYPIARGSAPPLVALSSFLLYAQFLTPIQTAGVVAISIGILTLAADKPVDRAHKWQAIWFGLLTGLTIMGYTICDGQGIRHAGDTEREQIGYIIWLFVLDTPLFVIYCYWQRGRRGERPSSRRTGSWVSCGAALSLDRLRHRHHRDAVRRVRPCLGPARDQRDLRRLDERLSPEGALPQAPLRLGDAGGLGRRAAALDQCA